MPILDPSLAFSLLNTYEKVETIYNKRFFPYFLKIAAHNFNTNFLSIESSLQFKIDLRNGIDFLNSSNLFVRLFSENEFNSPTIKNIFRYLFKRLKPELVHPKTKKTRNVTGFYKISDRFNMKFFQPRALYPELHAWYLTTTPIAVLCIDTFKFANCKDIQIFFQLLNLEIDIMESAGYALVLCLRLNDSCFQPPNNNIMMIKNFKNLMANHFFYETHLDIYNLNSNYEHFLDENFLKSTSGYIYLYSSFLQKNNIKLKGNNINPTIFNISFSVEPKVAIKADNFVYIQNFIYNESSINENDLISISLSNIPLYDDPNEVIFTPSEVSNIALAYISKDDFISWTKNRIKILYNEEENNDRLFEKYADSSDIHNIKADFYVNETIFLTDIPKETLNEIDDIINKIPKKYKKIKNYNVKIFKELFDKANLKKGLKNCIYAYTSCEREKNPNFKIHKNQVLTALQACNLCIFEKKRTNHGIVFQVDTGEGKSCIIQIIAAVIALMGKKVHIASSNINLANRDYESSLEFYRKVGVQPSVLLHENERTFNEKYDELKSDLKNKFPEKFFHEKHFKNASNMNYNVCDNAQVIYSTFVNFESYYLHLMEMYPGSVNKYFSGCSLLIDEADSILIDEITNGTILSHSIKSNATEVLTYVYNNRSKPPEVVLDDLKKNGSKCSHLTVEDIIDMYHDIDIIEQKEFVDGKKYSVEDINFTNKREIVDNFEKYENNISSLNKDLCDEIKRRYENIQNNEDEEENKKESLDANNQSKTNEIKLKHIVPFDYDHKGILEPNKEFCGFIQQFIAIRENEKAKLSKKDENMLVKDLSMNYLYVSHPIFVELYNGVCGFTGTIGNKNDIQILQKQYQLIVKKIPRENPNNMVHFPMILCGDSIEDRNDKIVSEIISFHNKGFPVLVIFQDMNEISDVAHILKEERGINHFNIFDGKDEAFRPDSIAGSYGSISLGTNICGRGTSISNLAKPLHVIVTYYTKNKRIMRQAFGRTARQGKKGTVRIICKKNEFVSANIEFDVNEIQSILNDFQYKNEVQRNYINHFRESRGWIFDSKIGPQNISDNYIRDMRMAYINVNRAKACDFTFPVCMSVDTFLEVEAQKIFSLYNCPNCKYTWQLFQKYIREIIFESFSLTINKFDRNYRLNQKNCVKQDDYKRNLDQEIRNLYSKLEVYLPSKTNKKDNSNDIVPTFMNIFYNIVNKYTETIKGYFPNKLTKFFKDVDACRFVSFNVGFKPFTLMYKSGSRINDGDDNDSFIEDPELKYQQRVKKKTLIYSITKKIDQIFDHICEKINETIGGYTGLKFFIRRTLGGCEFGICYDFELENNEECSENLLVDRDPLFLFTISVKCKPGAPLLAGILIFCLVYITVIIGTVSEYIALLPEKLTKDLIKISLKQILFKFLKDKAKDFVDGKIGEFFDKIIEFIVAKINEQVDKFANNDIKDLFRFLTTVFSTREYSKASDEINGLFEFNIKCGKFEIGSDDIPYPTEKLLKIGVLLILCFSAFMMNFNSYHKRVRYDESKVSQDYEKDVKQNHPTNFSQYNNIVPHESITPPEINDDSFQNLDVQDDNSNKNLSSNYQLKIGFIQATDIPRMDVGVNKYCDPYIVLKSSDGKNLFKTSVIKNSKEPIWNEVFFMYINPENCNEVLTFVLKDRDKILGKEIGQLISNYKLSISDIPVNQAIEKWVDMNPIGKIKKGGKLKISFQMIPVS